MVADCDKIKGWGCEDLTDEDLVHCALDGNMEAFRLLFDRHEASFLRLAKSVVKNEADAHDVVQNAFVSVFRKLHTFNEDGSFAGWSYRVVKNEALMHLRREKRRKEVDIDNVRPKSVSEDAPPDFSGFAEWNVSPERALATKQLRRHILEAIDDLEPKYRVAIELREFEGMSMAEMSDALGLSVGGVKTRLHRARSFLRVWLGRHYEAAV